MDTYKTIECNCGSLVVEDQPECLNCGILIPKMIEARSKKLQATFEALDKEEKANEADVAKKKAMKKAVKKLSLVAGAAVLVLAVFFCVIYIFTDNYELMKKEVEFYSKFPETVEYLHFSEINVLKNVSENYEGATIAWVRFSCKNAMGMDLQYKFLFIWKNEKILQRIDVESWTRQELAKAMNGFK